MTVKKYLSQAYILDRKINLNLEKIAKMRSALEYKSPNFDVLCGGNGSADKFAETVAKINDYENRTNALVDELVNKRIEIENAVRQITDPIQQEVIERRYLLYQSFENHIDKRTGDMAEGIAECMGYSARQIYRIHDDALKNFKIPKMSADVIECHP